jgi:hypothetical protein
LTRVRNASIDRHALDRPPASIGAPASVQAGAKNEEIWQIVAFPKKLPGVSEAGYKGWTAVR